MRAWRVRILACLALGLVSTIAVAWASAAFHNPNRMKRAIDRNDESPQSNRFMTLRLHGHTGERVDWTLFLAPNTFAETIDLAATRTALAAFQHAGTFPRWWGTAPDLSDELADQEYYPSWEQDARGWPVVALRCDWEPNGVRRSKPAPSFERRAHGGIDLPPFRGGLLGLRSRALPYLPIWRGVIADTFLFAFVWSALLFVPRAIRTRLRQSRGLCPACGYDLAGNTTGVCPECGQGKAAERG